MPPALSSILRIAFAAWELLWFHTNFSFPFVTPKVELKLKFVVSLWSAD